ncbi:MAG: M48 family metallopeptidase [Gammaproteobacteria bacterium]|nr:M48 family metallopeptidase [Gammaproteobacteria bacterium]MBT8443178.1 M48 family metallopeptidase [Gammaproteobacteria bacterium]NND37425.1 M48 family metallopeptidase [Gammaproteobacteria bacterium]
MSALAAKYFDGKTAASRDVTVNLSIRGSLSFEDGKTRHSFRLEELAISPRLAGQPAVVDMPDGARLEVADADAFFAEVAIPDAIDRDWEHRLESYWSRILVVVLVTGVLAWWFVNDGVPLVARGAAAAAPVELDNAIGERGLEFLDDGLFEESELSADRQAELRALFADVVDAVGDEHAYRIEFRAGGRLGPNAIALPSGIVVMTDELVGLSADDTELAAVMAHEVGHARNRHALRALIQNSMVAGMLFLVLGDPSGATTIAAGIPTLLVERSFSREFEREADDVAFEYLALRGIPDSRFSDLMQRLAEQAGDGDGLSLLSTHPSAGERARR